MALDTTLLNNDVANMVNDLPVTVTTDYEVVTGTKSSLRREDILIDEGLRNDYEFSVYFQKSNMTTVPDIYETVTISGVVYRVLAKTEDNTNQLLRLDLGAQYAND